jgi:diguanylate cyclase (GGDEF)-like protein
VIRVRSHGPGALRGYAALVTVPGVFLFIAAALTSPPAAYAGRLMFWAFSAFLLASELWPLKIQRGNEHETLTASTTFVFSLLLACGLGAAVVAFAVASAVSAAVHGRRWWKCLFIVGQYALCLVGSAMVLAFFTNVPIDSAAFPIRMSTLVPLALAAATFFALNTTFIAAARALSEQLTTYEVVARDFTFQIYTAGVLLALAPIVVVAAERTLGLVPFLILPILAVYKTATTSLAREHDALHDGLTGLPNRILFRDRVEQAAARARRHGGSFAVMVLDLDGFKEVNDTLGHHVGDVVLQRVAACLGSTLRDADTVARLGGDEFAVLVPEVASLDDAAGAAHRLLAGLRQPLELDDLTLGLDASVGVACYPDHADDVELLMEQADIAMYSAKRGRSGWALYRPDRDRVSHRRMTLSGGLREAIEHDQLVLHYQPKARLSDGAVTSVEALVRWLHPDFGLVEPREFLPLAEQSGAMRSLTSHVLVQALAQWRCWHDGGIDLGLSVNLSTQNFHDLRLPDEIGGLLEEWRVPARYLQVEITERVLFADPVRAENVLAQLADMGVRLDIDDFGTGYSSLAYLKRLPVHGIKIDKSFVQNLAHPAGEGTDAVIVRSTIDLARNLDLEVVAEGVESVESYSTLRSFGCDYAQGFLLGRPLPPECFEEWFRAHDGHIASGLEVAGAG